jgi:hypothetical protein
VTFTLSGFATLKRDGVELSGTGVVKIDADMKVGGVAETITVTGETPAVDVQSTRRDVTLDSETMKNLPSVRNYSYLGQEYGPRIRQLDFSIKKAVTIWNRRLTAGLDILNVTNNNVALAFNTTFAPSVAGFLSPTSYTNPRVFRLSAQYAW